MSQRLSNTCTECSRRKIRCNKQIPCDNCQKRGRRDLCERPNVISLEIPRTISTSSHSSGVEPYELAGTLVSKLLKPLTERLDRLESLYTKHPDISSSGDTTESVGAWQNSFILESDEDHPAEESRSKHNDRESANEPPNLAKPTQEDTEYVSTRHLDKIGDSEIVAKRLVTSSASNLADHSSQVGPDQETTIEGAATILEYLARGRLTTHVSQAIDLKSPPMSSSVENGSHLGVRPSKDRTHAVRYDRSSAIEAARLENLQELLPLREQVTQLVEYHRSQMLWLHNSFHGPTFSCELADFYETSKGQISLSSTQLQWTSLLFAVLSSTLCCAKTAHLILWRFREEDQEPLTRLWCDAVSECQSLAQSYDSHNIYTPQAISTLTWSAHALGNGDRQNILEAAAIRMMQSLRLHRITNGRFDDEHHPGMELNDMIQQETSRRLWHQLTQQDWFSIPFSEIYSISPLHFSSDPPLNCDDETMEILPTSTPSITTYTNFMKEVAILIPRLQDSLAEVQTEVAKYQVVLEYDRMMRDIVLHRLPPALSSQTPIHPAWPEWIPLARHSATITLSNKIIMIHRHFLWQSLRDPAYAFTRATCLAAARTTLNEFIFTQLEDMPNFWHLENFSIVAGIILSLDNFNRDENSKEYVEHRKLLAQSIELLSENTKISTIAYRGVRLLTELRKEEETLRESPRMEEQSATRHKRNYDGSVKSRSTAKPNGSFKIGEFVGRFLASEKSETSGFKPPYPSNEGTQSFPLNQGLATKSQLDGRSVEGDLSDRNERPYQWDSSYDILNSGTQVYPTEGLQNSFDQNFTGLADSQELEWFDNLLGLATVPHTG